MGASHASGPRLSPSIPVIASCPSPFCFCNSERVRVRGWGREQEERSGRRIQERSSERERAIAPLAAGSGHSAGVFSREASTAGHGVKLIQGIKLAQANLGVGAFCEQELGLFEAVIGNRHVQRRLALLVLAIDIGALALEPLRDLEVPVLSCDVQRLVACLRVLFGEQSWRFHEQQIQVGDGLHHVTMSGSACAQKRGSRGEL